MMAAYPIAPLLSSPVPASISLGLLPNELALARMLSRWPQQPGSPAFWQSPLIPPGPSRYIQPYIAPRTVEKLPAQIDPPVPMPLRDGSESVAIPVLTAVW